jgi:hypothetical protein
VEDQVDAIVRTTGVEAGLGERAVGDIYETLSSRESAPVVTASKGGPI